MVQASSWRSSITSLAVGCSREQGGQAGQHHTPAEQLLLRRQRAPSSSGQPTAGSPIPSPHTRPISKQPLLLPAPGRMGWLGHCAKVNIYVVGAFLPLPCIFSPFLKCHRSAVFIIVQEMSSLLAGSLTPPCAGSTVAALLISAAGSCIYLGSSEDGFGQRGDGTVRDTGTELHDYGSLSHSCSLEESLSPGPRVRSGSRETRHSVYATSEQTSKPD